MMLIVIDCFGGLFFFFQVNNVTSTFHKIFREM